MSRDQKPLYPFDHCFGCGGPVKVEIGGNSEGHYIERVTCVRGCINCYKAWMAHKGQKVLPPWMG